MYPYKKPRPGVPLAPFVDATVSAVMPGGSTKRFEFQVDTGADRTCLSSEALKEIGSSPVRRAKVEGVSGEEKEVCVHLVTLSLNGKTFRDTPVLEIRDCLLGRDVINKFRIELNGPSEYLELL